MSPPSVRKRNLASTRILAVLLFTFGAELVSSRPARSADRQPNANERSQLCAAIQILKDYEKCCRTQQPQGFSSKISVAACLEKIKRKNNITVGKLEGPSLGAKTNDDTSPSCTAKDKIRLCKNLFDTQKASKDFITLLSVLYHEGTHAVQDLSKATVSNYKDKITGPIEVQAWQNNQFFNRVLKDALMILERNLRNGDPPATGMTSCQQKLTSCFFTTPRIRVSTLVRQSCRLDRMAQRTIDMIKKWLRRNCPPSRPRTGSPRNRVAKSRLKAKFAVTGPGDERVLLLEDDEVAEDWAESDLFTGLTEILGIAFQERTDGVDHLIVTGHRRGRGIIQIWEDLDPQSLDSMSLLTEADLGDYLLAPSGLCRLGPEESSELLVWDDAQSQLFLFVDLDLDGVVDALDTAPRYNLPIPADESVRLIQLDDYEYALEGHAIGTVTSIGSMIRVRDLDQNGFFDPTDDYAQFLPEDDPEQEPRLETEPFELRTAHTAVGAPGHELQLWHADGSGFPAFPLGSSQTVVSSENLVDLTTFEGLAPGTSVTVVDLTNEAFSPPEAVRPPEPAVYGASPGRGVAGTWVSQIGDFVALDIDEVRVDGQYVPWVSSRNDEILYMIPPNIPVPGDGISDVCPLVHVQVIYDSLQETLDLSPFSYEDPLLTSEYEVRKGNISDGAGGLSDVLRVNGSAGNGNARVVAVSSGELFQVFLEPSPVDADGVAPFALYAWSGEPGSGTVKVLPGGTGSIGRATPLDGGCPGQPLSVANNTGFSILGLETWPGPPTTVAPSAPLTLFNGLQRSGVFTLQAVFFDSGAPNGVVGVSNAVIVDSE